MTNTHKLKTCYQRLGIITTYLETETAHNKMPDINAVIAELQRAKQDIKNIHLQEDTTQKETTPIDN